MKMPKDSLAVLLDGMEEMLLPYIENTTVIKRRKGSYLLAQGMREVKSKGGIIHSVDPMGNYDVSETRKVKVNHRNRMKSIIESCKNMKEVDERLAEYLAKFGNPAKFIDNSQN